MTVCSSCAAITIIYLRNLFSSCKPETLYLSNQSFSFPPPLGPGSHHSIIISMSMNFTTLGTWYKWNRRVSVLCGWLIPLSMMSTGSVHVVAGVKIAFPFKVWLTFYCMYIPHLTVHSIISGRLGFLHLSTIVDSAAMNVSIQVSFQDSAFDSLGCIPNCILPDQW